MQNPPQVPAAPPTRVRYRVLFWLGLAAALAYLCRNAIGVAESRIREDLSLSLRQSGWAMAAFFWTYALFQVPGGSLSQRFGTRVALTLFIAVSSVGMLSTALSPGLGLLIISQLVMGTAQAGIFPASTNSIHYWMPMSQRSFGCGVLTVGMQVGAIAASLLTGVLLSLMGWRWAFTAFALPGLIWAIVFALRFRDQPSLSPFVNSEEQLLIKSGRPPEQVVAAGNSEGPTDWKALLAHSGVWLIYGQQVCRAAGYMFFASWFPTFLQQTRGVSSAHSGYLQGVVFAGALAGGLLGGVLTDWIWRRSGSLWASRSGVGSFALGSSGLLILASWFVEQASVAVGLLALGVLFASLAGPATFAVVIDISGARVPQVLGAVNMTGNLAVAICPIIVGEIFARTANWNLVLLLFAGLYLTGAVCWLFVDPRRQIFVPTSTEP